MAPDTGERVLMHKDKHQCKSGDEQTGFVGVPDSDTYQTHSSGRMAEGPPPLYNPCVRQRDKEGEKERFIKKYR